jgi:hypothetical protein
VCENYYSVCKNHYSVCKNHCSVRKNPYSVCKNHYSVCKNHRLPAVLLLAFVGAADVDDQLAVLLRHQVGDSVVSVHFDQAFQNLPSLLAEGDARLLANAFNQVGEVWPVEAVARV